mmetsp:Transcript_25784/g.53603  ORF Transcript_25784/g.53603 Transcript_25784/m.53603 type:complete len:249 (+) Transcript_25784:2057-2803(+)
MSCWRSLVSEALPTMLLYRSKRRTRRLLSSACRLGLFLTSTFDTDVELGLKSCSMQVSKLWALRTLESSSTIIFSKFPNSSSTTFSTLFLVDFSRTTILYILQASIKSELFDTALSTVMRIRSTVHRASATGITLTFRKRSSVRHPAIWQTMFLATLMQRRVKLWSSWKKDMLLPTQSTSSSALFSLISSPSGILAAGRGPNISTPEMRVSETTSSSAASSQRKLSAEMIFKASSPRSRTPVPAFSEK